jgi:TetR/AcrR family transcriptional regulator, lmrAB and yxaGH operons repressor
MPAASAPPDTDTRSRILQAALLLFRRRGYHGVGINDILAIAKAPKGSLYHHFPKGKDQMAVEVIELVTERILAMLGTEAAGADGATEPSAATAGRAVGSTAALMRQVGARLRTWMQHTAGEGGTGACALIASFAAEGDTAVAVAAAAKRAYQRVAAVLAGCLEDEGWSARAARDCAFMMIALLEGGGLVSQTMGEQRLFTAAIERAAALCDVAPPRKVTS